MTSEVIPHLTQDVPHTSQALRELTKRSIKPYIRPINVTSFVREREKMSITSVIFLLRISILFFSTSGFVRKEEGVVRLLTKLVTFIGFHRSFGLFPYPKIIVTKFGWDKSRFRAHYKNLTKSKHTHTPHKEFAITIPPFVAKAKGDKKVCSSLTLFK